MKKKWLAGAFALLFAIGCNAGDPVLPVTTALQSAPPQEAATWTTDAPFRTADASDLPMDGAVLLSDVPGVVDEALFPHVWVADGMMYGYALICYVDGIGLCYDFDGWTADECTLTVEREVTQDIAPFETHRLLLSVGGETFCLGELRYDTEHLNRRNFFGKEYDWVVMDSDLCEAEPEEIRWIGETASEDAQANDAIRFDPTQIAFLTGFDAEHHTIDVLTARQTMSGNGVPFALDVDSIAETPITLTVPENVRLTVSGTEYPFMPVTRDRFFDLLENGYIGFLPTEGEDYFSGVYLGHADGRVTYLCEVFLP